MFSMKRLPLLGRVLLYLLISFVPAHAQLTRVPNTTLNMPQNPANRGYMLQQQFGRAFSAPVALVTPPGETNRLFIVEQNGRISLITNLTAATPTILTFLDFRTRVSFAGEMGLLGLAFHPRYQENGTFFIFYCAANNRRNRLSRLTVSADPNAANPASEVILIDQIDDYSNHNGGDLHFGPDGYLYVSL